MVVASLEVAEASFLAIVGSIVVQSSQLDQLCQQLHLHVCCTAATCSINHVGAPQIEKVMTICPSVTCLLTYDSV